MTVTNDYTTLEPTRADVDALPGATVLEFGVPWCPHCQAAQPIVAPAFAAHPAVKRLKVEDGRGRPLGRSYRVKLWPTFVFLKNGNEVARLVRPADPRAVHEALTQIDTD